MSQVTIRPEEPRDYARVFEVQEAAFGQPAEARLVDVLRESAQPQVSLVAETPSGEVVGHIFFSPVEVRGEDGGRPAIALAPVGVDPAFQRRGVGTLLCRAGIEACRALGESVAFVLGHRDYYPRFGFVSARPHGLFYKSEHFDGSFFALELSPGALAGFSGEVAYLPAFDAV